MNRTHGTVSAAMAPPILGSPSVYITIIEFGNYPCTQCSNWFDQTKPVIIHDYIDAGKDNMIFVDSVFLETASSKASQASYCAEDQGRYLEFYNLLYGSRESTFDVHWASTEKLKEFVFVLRLDMELFEICLDSEKYSKRVQYNFEQARKNEVYQTLEFFIVGPNDQEQINNAQSFSTFKQIMDQMI